MLRHFLKWVRFSCAFFILLTTFVATAAPAASPLLSRPEINAFIEEMQTKHRFSKKELEQLFETVDVAVAPSILKAISTPYEALPWHRYQKLFMTPEHIRDGVAFWQRHEKILARAEKEFGIPPEIIVAILGVETRYGTRIGKFKVLDALVTLSFDYPPRSPFFKKELEAFLLLIKEERLDPQQIKGSYAGAFGQPQFISSSYRNFAIDFSGTGKRDIIHDTEDAIGSVANYFRVHGWETHRPIALLAKVEGGPSAELSFDPKNPKPEKTLGELIKLGIKPTGNPPVEDEKAAFMTLLNEQGPEYWLGFQNFYVITRYNHSHHYAMAVFQLSEKIKKQYHQASRVS